jgi:guanylate kinase
MSKRLIVVSAPSGAGKTTISRHILERHYDIKFSVSATTRPRRLNEVHGRDYFFLSREEFEARIKANDLVEYETIFGNLYGTLKSEVSRALEANARMLFDIDVKGGLSLRKAFPKDTLLVFIQPPSLEVLRQRLEGRQSETPDSIDRRIARARMEMEEAAKFDFVVVNDDLNACIDEVEKLMELEPMGHEADDH